MSRRTALIGVALCAAVVASAHAQQLVFADPPLARQLLSTEDDYAKRMSAGDRAARLRTERAVSTGEYLAYAAAAARIWKPAEKRSVAAAYVAIKPALDRLALPLPAEVVLIKTSGDEEGDAAYTRQNAVILPASYLQFAPGKMRRTLAHELFHVSSRMNPKLASRLYEVIGFHFCGATTLPAWLTERRITNPDALEDDHCIALQSGTTRVSAVPIIYLRAGRRPPRLQGNFFDRLQFGFWIKSPPQTGNALVSSDQLAGFYEQVGRNTQYVIHPEEIIAENFALAATGARDLPSPNIPARIEQVLREFN